MRAWPRSIPASFTLYSPACFFLTSIAFTAGWTAISSLIGYYKALYGPHMLLHLNLAYFLPSLPPLILQSVWDAKLDGKYGIAKAATVRLCLGVGGSAVICAIYPFYEASRTILLLLVSLLGLCNSIAFSTSYQIVTHFGTSNSVALTTGKGVQLGLVPESLQCFCILHGIAVVGTVDARECTMRHSMSCKHLECLHRSHSRCDQQVLWRVGLLLSWQRQHYAWAQDPHTLSSCCYFSWLQLLH
ncbi:TPA: hypothetical protein ACH3X2_008857 [Trebouxia sp. C0005]